MIKDTVWKLSTCSEKLVSTSQIFWLRFVAVLGTLPYHELCKNNMKSLEPNTRSVSYFFIWLLFCETKIANLISSIFSKTFSEEKKISKNSCYQTFVPIMILYENPEINVIFFYIVLFFIWLDKKNVDFLLALINPR